MHEFEIEVHAAADGYRVDCWSSSNGTGSADMVLDPASSALRQQLELVEFALLSSSAVARRRVGPDEQAVQSVGDLLFQAVFAGSVLMLFDSTRHAAVRDSGQMRVVLRLAAPELAALPWEFLYDARRGDFLGLSVPLVRHPEMLEPVRPLRIEPPLRILGMVAEPTGTQKLDVDSERSFLAGCLTGLDRAVLDWVPGQTWRSLAAALRTAPWHVLHLMGHGGLDRDAGEGILQLSSEDGSVHGVLASDFARLVNRCPSLRLVVLNSCESARGVSDDPYSSIAVALIRMGVPAVLAMQYPISDRAAIEFTRAFYAAIALGRPVDDAVLDARLAVRVSIPGSLEWGTPVLFLRQRDGRLFEVDGRGDKPSPPVRVVATCPAEPAYRGVAGTPSRGVSKVGVTGPRLPAVAAQRRSGSPAGLRTTWRTHWRHAAAVAAVAVMVVSFGVATRHVSSDRAESVEIPAEVDWTDTGIELRVGQRYRITAVGMISPQDGIQTSPAGLPSAAMRLLPDSPYAALIARIDTGAPFTVGTRLDDSAKVAGTLRLGVNDLSKNDNTGAFRVTVNY